MRSPVAIFLFNRPEETRRVLSSIFEARPSELFVIADGPRPGVAEDIDACEQARGVVDEFDWLCPVHRCYSEINLGCTHRVSSGLDWVFFNVPEAVILEDDCLPSQQFFSFCDEMLELYREEPRVHMVSGSNYLFGKCSPDADYYFSNLYHIWGWASWRRAWRYYDVEMRAWSGLRKTDWVERHLSHAGMARTARFFFDGAYEGFVNAWDYQWVLSGWLQGAYSITPASNLITNLGFGPNATHTLHADAPLAKLKIGELRFPLNHPAVLECASRIDQLEWQSMYGKANFRFQRLKGSRFWKILRRFRKRLSASL